MIARLRRHMRQHGAVSTLCFVFSRVLRHWSAVVYEADLTRAIESPEWLASERLQIIGPRELDAELTPDLYSFMGSDFAFEQIQGIREGDVLFVVRTNGQVHHSGIILFQTRQTHILGEADKPPIIGYCQTAPEARGRGLYRRALIAELCYLRALGYKRAIVETHPDNMPSRRGIEAAGFALCRQASVWICLNMFMMQSLKNGSEVRRIFRRVTAA